MGVIYKNYLSKGFTIECLRKTNLIPCFYCNCVLHETEILYHSNKCSKRFDVKVQNDDQLSIELSLIIFKFNDTRCPAKQEKYLEFKGIDLSDQKVFLMVAHLYLLIEYIKRNKKTPSWINNPSHFDHDYRKYVPSYILYYIESNKEQIFCEKAGKIFDLMEVFYEKTPLVFSRKFLNWETSIGRNEDGQIYLY